MGLVDQKCDSCEQEVGVLFPVAMLVEMPTGGMRMVQRWYCIECSNTIVSEAEEAEEEEDEDDEENLLREYTCGCLYKSYSQILHMLWVLAEKCDRHWEDETVVEEGYSCGCYLIKKGSLYLYKRICREHE